MRSFKEVVRRNTTREAPNNKRYLLDIALVSSLSIMLAACDKTSETLSDLNGLMSVSDTLNKSRDDEKRKKENEDEKKSLRDHDESKDLVNSKKFNLTINKASWDIEDNEFKIEGNGTPKNIVSIVDASSGSLIVITDVNKDGEWKVKLSNLSAPPCRIRAEADKNVIEYAVKNAPENCGIAQGTIITPNPSTDPTPTPAPIPIPTNISGNVQVFGFNDLGMHCMDEDYSVFSVLPPFNVLHAQVIQKGTKSQKPQLLSSSQVDVQYSAVADPNGSINSTSIGKTNFWSYVQDLFNMSPAPDTGLLGLKMPSELNGPQTFPEYNSVQQQFSADGIPITPFDDAGNYNPYPLLNVTAIDKTSGTKLSSLNVTVPVSTEMNCFDCHNTGGLAADDQTAAKLNAASIAWSNNPNSVMQYKENILILHDAKHNTNLVNNTPVLCADCHYSPALDLAGAGPQGEQIGKSLMSYAVHGRHGMTVSGDMPDTNNPAIISSNEKDSCYNCHPGKKTQCFRGAMFSAGLSCQNCHGGLLAIAGKFPLADGSSRQPWRDLPQCQSCHTGDAIDHLGNSIILSNAFQTNDNSAQPIIANNKRFAENDNTLYRNSKGHGGVNCEACHGSTHAIWPVGNINTNDNLTAIQLQGHAGYISECSVCHEAGSLPLTLSGPHGMHNVNDSRWNENHESFYERNSQACKACHGANLKGTVLSRLSTDRVFKSDKRQADGTRNIALAKGTEIGCDICHEMP